MAGKSREMRKIKVRRSIIETVGVVALLCSLSLSADEADDIYGVEGSDLVLPVESLNVSKSSFDFDWKHAKINVEHDDMQYGLRLNRGEFSIGSSESEWKTTFDIPDQQIKMEWEF
jgi:hypothetical protein